MHTKKLSGIMLIIALCAFGPAAAIAATVTGSDGVSVAIKDNSRVICLGGAVTETVFALGHGAKVIGVDLSSTWPEDKISKLPKVGYWRTLSAEGILSLKPSLILAAAEAGPPHVIEQLRAGGVAVLRVGGTYTPEGVAGFIQTIAKAMGDAAGGEKLVQKLQADIAAARRVLARKPQKVSAAILYLRGPQVMNAGGRETQADAMLQLCGARNVMGSATGWVQCNAEALIAAAPEVLIVTDGGLESVGGRAAFLKQPGVAQTPAGKNGRLLVVDDLLLLGFGPRLGQAMQQVVGTLYPTGRDQGR